MESRHVAEMNNVLVMSREFVDALAKQIAEVASAKAIEHYRTEREQNEKLTIPEIALQEKCSRPTVIGWICRGIKKGKIKLPAAKKGKREYVVTRYDLNRFLETKKQLTV